MTRFPALAGALVALVLPLPAASADLSTADVLDMPEVFQVSVVAGSMSMLVHLTKGGADHACYVRWTASEDALALLASYAAEHPAVLPEPYPATLVAALQARCRAAE